MSQNTDYVSRCVLSWIPTLITLRSEPEVVRKATNLEAKGISIRGRLQQNQTSTQTATYLESTVIPKIHKADMYPKDLLCHA